MEFPFLLDFEAPSSASWCIIADYFLMSTNDFYSQQIISFSKENDKDCKQRKALIEFLQIMEILFIVARTHEKN